MTRRVCQGDACQEKRPPGTLCHEFVVPEGARAERRRWLRRSPVAPEGARTESPLDNSERGAARGFDPRRARFYASLLDAWSLPAGTPYRDLPDCALIAMCEDDPVGRGLPLYTFSRTAAEDGGLFGDRGDGSAIVIVNCEDPDQGTEIGRVAHDMLCADPRDMLVGPLADAARAAKERDVGPMSKWNDMVEGIRAAGRAEGKAEGMAEGKAEGRLAAYADLVRDGLLAQSAAAERLGMTQEQFAEEAAKLAPTGA